MAFCLSSVARSDGILDMWPGSFEPFTLPNSLFPNWIRSPTAGFMLYECDDLTCLACPTSSIISLTLYNYGSANGTTDITKLYFSYVCGNQVGVINTMSYAGVWNVGGPNYPAWTWAGAVAITTDPCDTKSGCWCYPSILVYSDIGPCPTDGATIVLGPGYSAAGVGGIRDNCGYIGPTGAYTAELKEIRYMMKTCDPTVAAPGDTINYTIFYGKPGTPSITNLTITDSQPAYTHWNYVASPTPDMGWDPNPGPPLKLRWTFPGPITTVGGATSQISFQLTADWGNGDSFEAGSGDVAAPEGEFLYNYSHMAWDGGGCAPGRSSNGVATAIRRYIFWKVGDNDVLFASRTGLPNDEMIYSISIKNVSDTKTWWKVSIWDTVPPEISVWTPGFGINDECVGWTMTPTGCAPASGGRIITGVNTTILTWQLDMPPNMTITLRWKGHVNPNAQPGSTAINIVSLMELGRSGIIGGTGHQGKPKNFTHLAPVVLRTTFISYVGFAGSGLGKRGMHIHFFPLNRMTNFELRGLEYNGSEPWASDCPTGGGVSASIGDYIGSCIGGFTKCTPGYNPGVAGCKSERAPAGYFCWSGGLPDERDFGFCGTPNCGTDPGCGSYPADNHHFIYKVVSNTPVLWQVFSCACGDSVDQHNWAPSTSLSFSGFTHYSFVRKGPERCDRFNIINTSVGPSDTLAPSTTTSVHVFSWDHTNLEWKYGATYELDAESQIMPQLPACNDWVKVISSQAKLVIHIGMYIYMGPPANNFNWMSATRNSGNLASGTPGEAFYIFPGVWDGYLDVQCIVTNMGNTKATYHIDRYKPRNPVSTDFMMPPWLGDNSGTWTFIKSDSVAPGLPWPGPWVPPDYNNSNPHIYGTKYDNTYLFSEPPGSTAGMWRIVLDSGGPIEVCQGSRLYSVYGGGSLLSASDGKPTGSDFWIGRGWSWSMSSNHCGRSTNLYTVDVFCPAAGMVVQGYNTQGYSATYTTNGSDQCVAFLCLSNPCSPGAANETAECGGVRDIFRVQISNGDAIVMYNHCQPSHKFFTAPFLATGVHYDIIAPPTVYVGQSFWITVVVVNQGGGTKTNYTGTISFTSTDPGAKVQGTNMESYNYTYSAAVDQGVKIFVNVVLTDMGLQTIVATDTLDGSITGLTTIQVVGADVKLRKLPMFGVAASGDTVQFNLCWDNLSTATAYTFVITDAIPVGTTYVPEIASLALCWSSTPRPGVTLAYSTSTATAPPTAYTSLAPTASASTTARWLRWTIRDIYVMSSGCLCYKVIVE